MRGSKLTHENFIERVKSLTNDYTVSSQYLGINKKVFFRHNICGKFFEMKAGKFINDGHRCPFCSSRAKKNFYDVFEKIKSKNENYILKEYKGMVKPAVIFCSACKTEFISTPKDILAGARVCPTCKRIKKENKKALNSETIRERIKRKFRNRLFPLGEIKTERTRMKFYCADCQNIFYSNGVELLENDYSCPYCRSEQELATLESILIFSGVRYTKEKKVESGVSFNFYLQDYDVYVDYLGTKFYDKKHTGEDIVLENSLSHRKRKKFVRENHLKALCIPFYDSFKFKDCIDSLTKTFSIKIPISYNQFITWKKSLGLRSYAIYQKSKK